jgi:riboflavin kinase/FMN adenylyltransferase
LGFPTINQKYPEHLAMPRFGVYAVKCSVDGKIYGGVANVGVKPTVGQEDMPLCETYLFGYSGDCYSSIAETEFVAFIREEKRFSSLDELKEQVLQDISVAKNLLKEF